MPLVSSGGGLLVYPARPAAARSAVTRGRIRDWRNTCPWHTRRAHRRAGRAQFSCASLAPREFMPVRMTALISAGDRLPPISPTPWPPRRAGSPPMTSRVVIAVAPIGGTARVAWAGGKILRAWASRSLWPIPRWPVIATPGSSSNLARQVTAPADRIPAVGNWVPGHVGGRARRCWGGVRAARLGRLLDGRREAAADRGRES